MSSLLRRGFEGIWDWHEGLLTRLWRLEDVGPAEGGFWRVRPVTYRGRTMLLSDGTNIAPGQTVGELHFRNATLRAMHAGAPSPRQVGWRFARALRQGLRELAALAAGDPRYAAIPAFYGMTMMHYGAELVGFDTRELGPGPRTRLLGFYQTLLTARHHPLGFGRARRGMRRRRPAEVWISRQRLLAMYRPDSEQIAEGDEAESSVTETE